MNAWLVAGCGLGIVCVALGLILGRSRRCRQLANAESLFLNRRPQLETEFFNLARSLGKPRGLRWNECQWQPDLVLATDKRTGILTAFVGMSVSFEAIAGEDMEDVAAVGLLRDATAVFQFRPSAWGNHGTWTTAGRVLFNMGPTLALERLSDQFDPVPRKPASP